MQRNKVYVKIVRTTTEDQTSNGTSSMSQTNQMQLQIRYLCEIENPKQSTLEVGKRAKRVKRTG